MQKIKILVTLVATGALYLTTFGGLARADTTAAFSISYSKNFNVGDTVPVGIYENSCDEPINAVIADLSYDPSKLSYMYQDLSGSNFFPASSSGGSGSTDTQVGSFSPVTGKNQVVVIYFQALASSSSVQVNFLSSSQILSYNTNSNIWDGTSSPEQNFSCQSSASTSSGSSTSATQTPSNTPPTTGTKTAAPKTLSPISSKPLDSVIKGDSVQAPSGVAGLSASGRLSSNPWFTAGVMGALVLAALTAMYFDAHTRVARQWAKLDKTRVSKLPKVKKRQQWSKLDKTTVSKLPKVKQAEQRAKLDKTLVSKLPKVKNKPW